MTRTFFPAVSLAERRQADLFFADLTGRSVVRPRRHFPPASDLSPRAGELIPRASELIPRASELIPRASELIEDEMWGEAIEALPRRYRRAYYDAQTAEEILDDEAIQTLTFDLLSIEDHAGLDEFVKKLGKTVSRAAKKAVRDVGRTPIGKTVSKAAKDIARSKVVVAVGKAAKDVSKGVAKVGAAVPMLSTALKLASRATPLGAFARAAYGAVSAALKGQNIFMGALDGLSGTPLFGALVKLGGGLLRGEDLLKAAKAAAKAGISDARDALRFAAMVAPFVPGIGTGVGAALGAADALANGQPITQALIAGVRGAIPGGVVAQAAFDTAAQLAQGKKLDEALLTAARNRLPPGPAQAAFDTGLSLARGKSVQDAMLKGAGGLLPASPYSADVTAFAKRALAGDNLGQAALSTAGQAVLRRARQQGTDLVATVQGRVAAAAPAATAAVAAAATAPRQITNLSQAITAAATADRRQAAAFAATLVGPSIQVRTPAQARTPAR